MIVISVSSQTDYPKLTLIDTDTVVLFTPLQTKKITASLLELDKQLLLNASLGEEIDLWKEKDSLCEKQIDILVEQNFSRDEIIIEKSKQFDLCDKTLEEQSKKLIKFRNQRKYFFIGGFATGSAFIYLIVKAIQ